MSKMSAVQAPFKALSVLVIEDNAIIGMLFAHIVKEMGHVVCAIEATKEEAVVAAARYKPDFMIVDVALADGSGLSAVNEILVGGFIPHVFVSGDAVSVLAAKPDAIVLQKPFRDSDLVRAVQRALADAISA